MSDEGYYVACNLRDLKIYSEANLATCGNFAIVCRQIGSPITKKLTITALKTAFYCNWKHFDTYEFIGILYSAFANSCPLQTDTFRFSLIQSRHILLSSNKFCKCNERLGRLIPCMGYPHKVTCKVKLAIIQTRVFSH